MNFVIAASRPGYEKLPIQLSKRFKERFVFIQKKQDLRIDRLEKLQPRYIFFPHWSYIIPSEIYERFECVIFHMTDVPFGRGGSPLQNLIARGKYRTKMSALRCGPIVDGGPVYLKRPFSLHGRAEDIYRRAAELIQSMITDIIIKSPMPKPQTGRIVSYKRRKPEEGNLAPLIKPRQVYDYIRMLDAEGYPKAFLETRFFRYEFERASIHKGSVSAHVNIIKK